MSKNYGLDRMFNSEWQTSDIATHVITCECGNETRRIDCKEVLSDETHTLAGQDHLEYSYYCPNCGAWLRTDYVLKEQENEDG